MLRPKAFAACLTCGQQGKAACHTLVWIILASCAVGQQVDCGSYLVSNAVVVGETHFGGSGLT
jgi:hypothetical protein